MKRFLPSLLLLLLLGCADPERAEGDLAADVTEVGPADVPVVVPETLEVAEVLEEFGVDALEEADARDTIDVGPAPAPEVQDLALDWAMQSSQSAGASLLYPAVLALRGGGVGVFATFDGSVRFGAHEVVSDDVGYTHVLYARVSERGEVERLRWVCDRCFGQVLERDDGTLVLAAVVEGEVVLAPGTPEVVRSSAERELLVVELDRDGGYRRHAFVAKMPGYGAVESVAATADGGLVIGGSTMGLEVGALGFVPEDGWHYPGRGFVVGVDAQLRPWFAEQLGGPAGSDVGLLHVEGDTLTTIGDFGGYPRGVHTTFGGGERTIELASVSSDDDPAMDIFVARWRLPVAAAGVVARPEIVWVRRIANYSNGPRPPTWIRARDGAIVWRIDGADALRDDDDGHYVTPYVSGSATLIVAADRDGAVSARVASASYLEPSGDGFVSVATSWPGSKVMPAGEGGPSFAVPEDEVAPDGASHQGHVLARWRGDGALVAAGLLLQRHARSFYPLYERAIVPAADGSMLVVLHGSAPITLVPSLGPEVELARDAGYERLVIARARLVPR